MSNHSSAFITIKGHILKVYRPLLSDLSLYKAVPSLCQHLVTKLQVLIENIYSNFCLDV